MRTLEELRETAVGKPFASREAFYASYPAVAQGWDWETFRGPAPWGLDLCDVSPAAWDRGAESFVVTFCFAPPAGLGGLPEPSTRGVVSVFDRQTGEIFVVDGDLSFAEARSAYQPASLSHPTPRRGLEAGLGGFGSVW